MTTPVCSNCRLDIPAAEVNVANDVAFCRRCNLAYKLSELIAGNALIANVDLTRPPAGAWCRITGSGAVVGATHRSLGTAMGLLFFALFWNGIVSVFVLLVTSATLHHLSVPVPDWFPAPKMKSGDMSVGMTMFLWIFLTPFIVIGVGMIGAFLSAIAGRTEVEIHEMHSVLFTGIGPLGWRRRFPTETAKDVRIDNRLWNDSDGNHRSNSTIFIELSDGKTIKLGSMLSEDRRKFVAAALRKTSRSQNAIGLPRLALRACRPGRGSRGIWETRHFQRPFARSLLTCSTRSL
ncbi:MAG: hypothetical protein HC841_09390 [Verrucomicrobiae bacterium]|nr:hypothetical protein [Verrucomicrobiae bacterium]